MKKTWIIPLSIVVIAVIILIFADVISQKKENNKTVVATWTIIEELQPELTETIEVSTWKYGIPWWMDDEFYIGNIYTYTYPDFWLRITTPLAYFWETIPDGSNIEPLITNPIFQREWNKIYSIINQAWIYWDHSREEYIKIYDKDPNESLLDIIQQKHLNSWCAANYIQDQDKIFWVVNVYDIFSESGIMDSRNITCYPDDEDNEEAFKVIRYFESKDKTKYYKMSFLDWCAPGPCTIFGKVEVLN